MKGFIFALDETADVERILARGVFGVRQPAPQGQYGAQDWDPASWSDGQLETFAELLRAAFLRRFFHDNVQLIESPDETTLRACAMALALRPISSAIYINAHPDLYVNATGKFLNEKTLHAALMEQFQLNSNAFPLSSLERSDCYHELPASPAKNPSWVDRMDIVACSNWPDTDVVTRYELVEAKKDQLSVGPVNTFDRFFSQPMRYVDFLARHYAGGNLHSIDVHVVAGSYSAKFLAAFGGSPTLPRHYSLSPRDLEPIRAWERVRLWSYKWTGTLTLHPVAERYG